jgi:DNA polymerase III gamma/tau subunit
MAHILKNELQCHPLCFREINASSERGIDTARDLIAGIKYKPSAGPVRVYILEEVQKLTRDFQSAMLTTLENLPDHSYVFLCTTDPDMLLKPLRSRCAPYPVQLLTDEELELVINRVSKKENIELDTDVLAQLIHYSEGSARDALVFLEKIRDLPQDQQIESIAQGIDGVVEVKELCQALLKRKSWSTVAGIVSKLTGDPESIRRAVLGYAKSVILNKASNEAKNMLIAFERNVYDSGMPGLVLACYEVIHSED